MQSNFWPVQTNLDGSKSSLNDLSYTYTYLQCNQTLVCGIDSIFQVGQLVHFIFYIFKFCLEYLFVYLILKKGIHEVDDHTSFILLFYTHGQDLKFCSWYFGHNFTFQVLFYRLKTGFWSFTINFSLKKIVM